MMTIAENSPPLDTPKLIPHAREQKGFLTTRDHPQRYGKTIIHRSCRQPRHYLPDHCGDSHDDGQNQHGVLRQGGKIHLHPHQHEEHRRENSFQLLHEVLDRLFGLFADEMITLFKAHEELAVSIQDKQRLGMFYAWIGGAFHQTGHFKDSYTHLRKSLELGELTRDQKIIGYICSWLSYTCGHIGYLDEAVKYGERARDLTLDPRAGLTLFDAAHGLVAAYWCTGDIRKLREIGTELVE